MRKLTASFFISLDGVVESPDKWHFRISVTSGRRRLGFG